jgi:hypothetical protein
LLIHEADPKVISEVFAANNNNDQKTTTAVDDLLSATLRGPMLLERFAVEIATRVLNHVCSDVCVPKFPEGKRTSTFAAGAVLAAGKHAGIVVKPEDVAACAQVGKATAAVAMMKCIEGHWSGMFADRSSEKVLNEMREMDVRAKAALGPTVVVVSSGEASGLVKI